MEAPGSKRRSWSVPAALTAAVLAISTAAPVIRTAEALGPEAVAALRVSVTALGLAVLTLPATREALRLLAGARREALLTALAGLCLAAHFAAWIASLWLTSVLRSVALVTTAPLWAGLLARLLGDEAPARVYLGAGLAVLGSVVMVADAEALAGGSWVGDLLALFGALTWAVYMAVGRHVHKRLGDALPVEGYFVSVNLVAAACLWAFALARGVELQGPGVDGSDYLAVLWLGLVPGIVGHGLMNWAVRRVPVHTVALAALLEPLGAALLAWVMLGEAVVAREGAGALVLLAGVALGVPRRGRTRARREPSTSARPPENS